jgi:hypothetical protein
MWHIAYRELVEAAQGRIGGFSDGMSDNFENILGWDGDLFVKSREDVSGEGNTPEHNGQHTKTTVSTLKDVVPKRMGETVRLVGQEDSAAAAMQEFISLIKYGDLGIILAAREGMIDSVRRIRYVHTRCLVSTSVSFYQLQRSS